MSTTVTVRDPQKFLPRLLNENYAQLPNDIQENGALFEKILAHAPRVLSNFARLSPPEIKLIAHTVAIFLRADIIYSGGPAFGANPVTMPSVPKLYGESGIIFHPLNDPTLLNSEFVLPKKYYGVASELFRCYMGTFALLRELEKKIDPEDWGSAAVPMPLAELTAFLLNPRDLKDCKYTSAELEAFHRTIAEELSNQ